MAGGQILGREVRLALSYCDLLPDDLRELSIRTFRKREGRIPTLEEQELEYILWALEEAHGNQPRRRRCWTSTGCRRGGS